VEDDMGNKADQAVESDAAEEDYFQGGPGIGPCEIKEIGQCYAQRDYQVPGDCNYY
jgi:hypothetical protein